MTSAISGDKLGGLTDHLGGLPDSEQVLSGLSDRGKPCRERARELGDKLSGLEFAGFSRQKTESGALEPEFGGSGSTFDA